jgi:1-acyl-sn-glycerol-3-phosphate acyltransferase
MIRATVYLVALVTLTAWSGMTVIVLALLRVKQRTGGPYDRAQRRWARGLLKVTRISVVLDGAERIPEGSAVFVSNHVSFVDIWALLAVLPGSIRFVFKREFLYFPIMGLAMRSMGHIPIDRGRRAAAFESYDRAADAIRSGISAVVFAEGTRSRDGKLHPFKKGPFVLGIAAGVPVVPVFCDGSYQRLAKGSLAPRPGTVTVRIGAPIATAGLEYHDRDRISEQARRTVIALGADPA